MRRACTRDPQKGYGVGALCANPKPVGGGKTADRNFVQTY